MGGNLSRRDPAEQIVTQMLPEGTAGAATGSIVGPVMAIRIPFSLTSTATANVSWINPEAGTVLANVAYMVVGTAGTGSVNIGRSSNGTGSASNWVTSGTLTAGLHDDDPIGGIISQWLAIGPGGTGTNNSVVGQLSDSAASTMDGCFVVIRYYRVG